MSGDTGKVKDPDKTAIWSQNNDPYSWEIDKAHEATSGPLPWGNESLADYLKRKQSERDKS